MFVLSAIICIIRIFYGLYARQKLFSLRLGELVLLPPDALVVCCIRFLPTHFAKKMFAARLKNATPFLVAGLAGSATLCGYQTRYSTGKQQTCFGFA